MDVWCIPVTLRVDEDEQGNPQCTRHVHPICHGIFQPITSKRLMKEPYLNWLTLDMFPNKNGYLHLYKSCVPVTIASVFSCGVHSWVNLGSPARRVSIQGTANIQHPCYPVWSSWSTYRLYKSTVCATTKLPNNNKQLDFITSIAQTNHHFDVLEQQKHRHTTFPKQNLQEPMLSDHPELTSTFTPQTATENQTFS